MNQRHAKLEQPLCRAILCSYQHAKLCAFDAEACVNMHEVHGGTTQGRHYPPPPSYFPFALISVAGVAVRGSTKL
jgi:hypothetical protein